VDRDAPVTAGKVPAKRGFPQAGSTSARLTSRSVALDPTTALKRMVGSALMQHQALGEGGGGLGPARGASMSMAAPAVRNSSDALGPNGRPVSRAFRMPLAARKRTGSAVSFADSGASVGAASTLARAGSRTEGSFDGVVDEDDAEAFSDEDVEDDETAGAENGSGSGSVTAGSVRTDGTGTTKRKASAIIQSLRLSRAAVRAEAAALTDRLTEAVQQLAALTLERDGYRARVAQLEVRVEELTGRGMGGQMFVGGTQIAPSTIVGGGSPLTRQRSGSMASLLNGISGNAGAAASPSLTGGLGPTAGGVGLAGVPRGLGSPTAKSGPGVPAAPPQPPQLPVGSGSTVAYIASELAKIKQRHGQKPKGALSPKYALSPIGRVLPRPSSAGPADAAALSFAAVTAAGTADAKQLAIQVPLAPNGSVQGTPSTEQLSFLKSLAMFHTMSEQTLMRIAGQLRRTVFPTGSLIVRQGDTPTDVTARFFIIDSGSVRAHIRRDPDDMGDIDGSHGGAESLRRDRASFRLGGGVALSNFSESGRNLLAAGVQQKKKDSVQVSYTNPGLGRTADAGGSPGFGGAQRRKQPNLGNIDESSEYTTSPLVLDGAVEVDSPTGSPPMRGHGRSMSADSSGTSQSEADNSLGVAMLELGRGMFFGELSLLCAPLAPRAATVVAITPVVCYALDKQGFDDLVASSGDFFAEFVRRNYTAETPEAVALSRHVHSYQLLLGASSKENLDLNEAVADDAELPPARALVEVMALFSPELSVAEVAGRVRRVVKPVLDAGLVEVFLFDHTKAELLIPSIAGRNAPPEQQAATKPGVIAVGPAAKAGYSGMGGESAIPVARSESTIEMLESTSAMQELGGRSVGNGYVRVPLCCAGFLREVVMSLETMFSDRMRDDERFQRERSEAAAQAMLLGMYPAPIVGSWAQQQTKIDRLLGNEQPTTSILAAPVLDGDGLVLGLIVVMNKNPRPPKVAAVASMPLGSMGIGRTKSLAAAAASAASTRNLVTDDNNIATGMDEEDRVLSQEAAAGGGDSAEAGDTAAASGSERRKSRRLTNMRTWTLQGTARKSSSIMESDLGSLDENSTRVHPAVTAADAHNIATPVAQPFTGRDTDIVVGVCEALARALDDRRVELDTLTGALEFTPLSTVIQYFRVQVGAISNVPIPGAKAHPNANGDHYPGELHTSPQLQSIPSSPAMLKSVSSRHSMHSPGLNAMQPPSAMGKEMGKLIVSVSLYHGGQELQNASSDPVGLFGNTPDSAFGNAAWNTNIALLVRWCNLPIATRVIFNIYYLNGTPVGWAGCNLFTAQRVLRMGALKLPLWPGKCDAESITRISLLSNDFADPRSVPHLTIAFHEFDKPVVRLGHAGYSTHPNKRISLIVTNRAQSGSDSITAPGALGAVQILGIDGSPIQNFVNQRFTAMEWSQTRERIMNIIKSDPLYKLSREEISLLWRAREFLTAYPTALPKFLQSVRWDDARSVDEAHRLLLLWRPPSPLMALELLQADFPDPTVRAYAVSRLEVLADEELHTFMLQLTQVLKFEPFLDSSLARFLLRRALRRPRLIGHVLYWFLRAEMHVKEVAERYGAILKQYTVNCDSHRIDLGHQLFVMTHLENIAVKVQKNCETKEERLEVLRTELPRIVFPERFQLPLSPHMVAKGIIAEKCRVMSSKKLPLWLVFNAAESPVEGYVRDVVKRPMSLSEENGTLTVLFKAGDDLRQDQLTLQILQVMDACWRAEGLDLRMLPYRCVSTGDEMGMIEVVLGAKTLANIVTDSVSSGGFSFSRKVRAALSAYREDVYRTWLEDQGFEMSLVEDNFVRSCAAYCVASYVLGIGDRHSDNIMLKTDGRLFHIDFGHFLGNFKYKLGYKRERAPFVFTPGFAAVMGGRNSEQFKRFETIACNAYNVLRHQGHLLITLFFLMLSSDLPELQKEEDLDWLREKLMLNATDEEAADHFRKQIKVSLHTKATQFNDAVHVLKHCN
jgi:phosphatidylinositol-4,5-bisphosphate 3-kinase